MNSFPRVISLTLLTLAVASTAQTVRTLRWAAIGGSVANAGYPARVGIRLPADSVISFAFNGGTVLKSGDSSYWTSGKLAQVFAFQPDIVSIQMGGNDSKPVNWGDSGNFERDYRALIDTLSSMPSQPRIIVVYPTPVWKNEAAPQSSNLLRGSVIGGSILSHVRKVARDRSADTVDLYTPLLARQNLFTDSINPSTAGSDTLGRRVFEGYVAQSIRVMCVGNSITYAAATSGVTAKDAYPIRLNLLLGKRYWVWNGGRVGDWMQRRTFPNSGTYKSYITEKPWMDTLFMRQPHYITIKLGTNDSRMNWWNTANYIASYQYFIDTLYNNLTPKPKFILIKPLPAWKVNNTWPFPPTGEPGTNGINGDIIRDSVVPAAQTVAVSRPAAVIGVSDMYTPFVNALGTLVATSDGVHPGKAGQDTIAHVLYRTFVANTTALNPNTAKPSGHNTVGRYVKTTNRWEPGSTKINTVDGKTISGNASIAPGVYMTRPKGKPASKNPEVTK